MRTIKTERKSGSEVSLNRATYGMWVITVDGRVTREVYAWAEANRRFQEVLANL